MIACWRSFLVGGTTRSLAIVALRILEDLRRLMVAEKDVNHPTRASSTEASTITKVRALADFEFAYPIIFQAAQIQIIANRFG